MSVLFDGSLTVFLHSFYIFPPAEFLSSMSRHEEACGSRVRAAELSPNDYQLVTAAATALRMLDRVQEAEQWYRQVRLKEIYGIKSIIKVISCVFILVK